MDIYRPTIRQITNGYHIEITDKELNTSYIINVTNCRNRKGDSIHRLDISGIDPHIKQLDNAQRKRPYPGHSVRLINSKTRKPKC